MTSTYYEDRVNGRDRELPSENTNPMNRHNTGSLNARGVSGETSTGCSAVLTRMLNTVKRFFFYDQNQHQTTMPQHDYLPLFNRTTVIHEEAAERNTDLNKQNSISFITIKHIALVVAAAGITAMSCLVYADSSVNGGEDSVEHNLAASGTLTATFTATAAIGRQLLFAPMFANAIHNSSFYPDVPFNLPINLSQVINNAVNVTNFNFSQVDGSPLPNWLTPNIIPDVLMSSVAIGAVQDIIADGDYTYVLGNTDIKIFDVKNIRNPTHVGTIPITQPTAMAAYGDHLFVSDGVGLLIYNLIIKANPVLVGSLATSIAANIIIIGDGKYATMTHDAGVDFIDIRDVTSPFRAGSIVNPYSVGVDAIGNYLFVSTLNVGLKIYDISSITNPVLASTVAMGNSDGITHDENYLFIAERSLGMRILDYSKNIVRPSLVAISTSMAARRVFVSGNYARLVDEDEGLKTVDISTITKPFVVADLSSCAVTKTAAVFGNFVCVGGSMGFKIFSATNIALSGKPKPINRGTLPLKLTITDSFGMTASTDFSITILNRPPIAPTLTTQNVHHYFNITIPKYLDPEGDPLTYSAKMADGSPLLDGVKFDSIIRALFGFLPFVVGVTKINITATDPYGGSATATQIINVFNHAPIAGSALLPSRNVKQGEPFNYSFDADAFEDPDNDDLIFSSLLPKWMTLINRTFSGIAPVGTTGSLSVIVKATDPFEAAASRSFDQNVIIPDNHNIPNVVPNPRPYTRLIETISALSVFIFFCGGLCAARNILWNKSMRCVYRLPTEEVVVTEAENYCYTISRLEPGMVASVKLLKDKEELLGEHWLFHNRLTGKLRIDKEKMLNQEGLIESCWTVQITNKGIFGGRNCEEFDFKFLRKAMDFNPESELRDVASSSKEPFGKMSNKQLKEPLMNDHS